MQAIDGIFGSILFLGGIAHAPGAWSSLRAQPATLLWSLAAAFAIFLLAGINLLRTALGFAARFAARFAPRPVA